MNGTKDAVHRVVGALAILHVGEPGFGLLKELAAFVEENASNRETLENQISFAIKTAPKLTIQGGTTEVLRGIIARGLGLR